MCLKGTLIDRNVPRIWAEMLSDFPSGAVVPEAVKKV